MWRLEAVSPEAAMESGGTLLCSLRVSLPSGYPFCAQKPEASIGGGIDVELAAPGSLGREAMKAVSRSAHLQAAQLRAESSATGAPLRVIQGLVDWVQGTEMHELAAASVCPSRSRSADEGRVRAFVRFHHVQSLMKRTYMRMWAEDLGVAALLAVGQPGMLLAEGPESSLRAFLERAMKTVHWGPTPARLVFSSPASSIPAAPRAKSLRSSSVLAANGLDEVSDVFPGCIAPGAAYNGRDSINYMKLAQELASIGLVAASEELQGLARSAFAHSDGRVQEASDGSGWVGYLGYV
ncbi:unnamed protein product [Polarella glacialis]|uniref:Uncharacterized protein n=1 Tax=Polarella glacialis TaxID=89957 RepID=A0A813ELP0_POLGL|nr:unnamed protein product [Polarella glacialis]